MAQLTAWRRRQKCNPWGGDQRERTDYEQPSWEGDGQLPFQPQHTHTEREKEKVSLYMSIKTINCTIFTVGNY